MTISPAVEALLLSFAPDWWARNDVAGSIRLHNNLSFRFCNRTFAACRLYFQCC